MSKSFNARKTFFFGADKLVWELLLELLSVVVVKVVYFYQLVFQSENQMELA